AGCRGGRLLARIDPALTASRGMAPQARKSRRRGLAEHHARMKTPIPSRRWQCRGPFVPDPRVGGGQVTCGAEECQRERHAERCRAWHVANRDVGTSHYADVVKPFREAQPDYQRRWRLAVRCREIREKTGTLGGVLLTSLRALL